MTYERTNDMGYEVFTRELHVTIPAGNVESAFDTIMALNDQDEKKGGLTSTGGVVTSRHFAFCPSVFHGNDLVELFAEIRWKAHFDEFGNVVLDEFTGENLGDDEVFFTALAPFIANQSVIEWLGQDGDRWRWEFQDGKMLELISVPIWQ